MQRETNHSRAQELAELNSSTNLSLKAGRRTTLIAGRVERNESALERQAGRRRHAKYASEDERTERDKLASHQASRVGRPRSGTDGWTGATASEGFPSDRVSRRENDAD